MKLVIVGGVAAGMSAAARGRRLDEEARIVVLEKGRHVSFANCGLPYHVGGAIRDRDDLLLQTPQSLQAALNLDVRVGHEVTRIDRARRTVAVREIAGGRTYEETYDKLVLCPGATPLRPPLPGAEHPRIFVLRNIDDMDQIKACVDGGARRAVVIGGGYIGVEMAENLRSRGLEVDLVEMMEQIMPPLDPEMARDLEVHMRWHGVRLHLGTAAAAFRDRAGLLAVELANGTTLEADLCLLAAGVKPDSTLARDAGLTLGIRGAIKVDRRLRTSDPDIYAAGDAIEVEDAVTGEAAVIPLAGPANRQGRAVADDIFGRPASYGSTQGTAVVKVFDMTGGGTGASEKTLVRLGRPYRKVYLHPSGHAGYYPGTSPMHLKVIFAPDTGKLLGAQAVGFDGVDKRLDVLATALRGGMTVEDLEGLELAYAPPFGSAKDPVNMAGFIGSNLRRGDLELWYAEDYPDRTAGGVILDVRGRDEFDLWHIPGATHIPLGQLRRSLDSLPRDRKVFVYCKVGFRSYLAYRILKQKGFDAATLSGGILTFCGYHGTRLCTGEPQPALLPYAEESVPAEPSASARRVEIDCTRLQCPGPIRKLGEAMAGLASGDELSVVASDPGFANDVVAWCRRRGHELLSTTLEKGGVRAVIRKGTAAPAATVPGGRVPGPDKKTMVVFSGDLDRVLAAFVIANGAASMGSRVTLFFTFWGLNVLRKAGPQAGGKGVLDRMFGAMMPRGPSRLKLSNLHMMGMGTAMMKHVMDRKGVDSLPALIDQARRAGVKLVACSMSMDVMGLKREELIDGVEIGGVATFLGESEGAGMTLFI